MQPASDSPERPVGRLHRARALYRNVSKRRTAWLLLKDTVNSCMEYRILGLAAEAAFFTLLSVPPLLLCLIGLLAYVDTWTGAHTIGSLETNLLDASRTVLSDKGVKEITEPILHDVIKGGRPDVISLGFLFALWSGSRAVNVFIDTITVMYGLDGVRGIVRTRIMSFVLFIVALLIGSVALPLMVAGPDAVVRVVPWSETVVQVLYWPVVIVLSVVFLTTLYHVSVPVRSPWIEDVPGALVALAMWVFGSFLLRIYLVHTIEGATIYGSSPRPSPSCSGSGCPPSPCWSARRSTPRSTGSGRPPRRPPPVRPTSGCGTPRSPSTSPGPRPRGTPSRTTPTTRTCRRSSPNAGRASCHRRTSPRGCGHPRGAVPGRTGG